MSTCLKLEQNEHIQRRNVCVCVRVYV